MPQSIIPYIAIFFFAVSVVFLIVASILAAFSAAEAEKKNTLTAQRYSIGASILTGLGILGVIVSAILFIIPTVWTKLKKPESNLAQMLDKFVDSAIASSNASVSIPMGNMLNLKNAVQCADPEAIACPVTFNFKSAAPAARPATAPVAAVPPVAKAP